MENTYRIENRRTGHVVGTYDAASEEDALDAMALDAGYGSYREALLAIGADEGDLAITMLDECAYCGAVVPWHMSTPTEDEWPDVAKEHVTGCEWIETRAHTEH